MYIFYVYVYHGVSLSSTQVWSMVGLISKKNFSWGTFREDF